MFIWDFVASAILSEILDWVYGQIIGFLGNFFEKMENMGVELFELTWVQAVVQFFSQLGWALFGVSLVVCAFECGIEYSSGRGNIRQTALNILTGFMAVSLFTTVPVRLYALSVSLQGTLSRAITGYGTIGEIAGSTLSEFEAVESLAEMTEQHIMSIQSAVGSLYMFSIPRGYSDGFIQWMKQVIGLCLTAFLQATILVAGLMVFHTNALLGLGLMLSAGEVPRIAGAFGLDTTTRANIMSAVYTAQAAVNTTKTVAAAVAK